MHLAYDEFESHLNERQRGGGSGQHEEGANLAKRFSRIRYHNFVYLFESTSPWRIVGVAANPLELPFGTVCLVQSFGALCADGLVYRHVSVSYFRAIGCLRTNCRVMHLVLC